MVSGRASVARGAPGGQVLGIHPTRRPLGDEAVDKTLSAERVILRDGLVGNPNDSEKEGRDGAGPVRTACAKEHCR